MKIGLIDVDNSKFPNLALMKISAWHKKQGDRVEWYEPLIGGRYDKVYISKVFSFTPDYQYPINADVIVRGGSGYEITVNAGKEEYIKGKDLIYPIEHIYPDYSLYSITDTAIGFMTRGCPRGCDFCIVGKKEGKKAYTVAPLNEFWNGQPKIVLLDPNPVAVTDWQRNFEQLIESNAVVEFNQGVDVRLMTEEKARYLARIKVDVVHFAWDRYEDKKIILPRLKMVKEVTGWGNRKLSVYVLVNYNTTLEQDLERVYILRDMGFDPYVMIYNKEGLPKGHKLRKLQRYVNAKPIFHTIESFDDYEQNTKRKD